MKSLYFFPFGIFLFIIGCESLFYDQDIQNPPSFEYLIQDISSELGLDYEQRNSARSSLERGRDFFPDPAALWELAKKLQQTLTQEQKDSLLSRHLNIDMHIISEENDHRHARLEHLNRMNDRIILLMTADQLPIYEELKETKLTLINDIISRYQNTDLERENMRFEMMSVMEWFRAEMKILLTEEQEEIITVEREQRDISWRRGRGRWGRLSQNTEEIKFAMQDALELTLDQISTLDLISNSMKTELDNLRNSYIEGINEISAEEFRLSIISIMEDNIDDREQVFTKVQKEIIEIHRALTLRFMRHARWGRI